MLPWESNKPSHPISPPIPSPPSGTITLTFITDILMPDPKTALITGASSGLGAEFARQLAARGYNLILTARRQSRLAELAQELTSKYPITVEILVADLAQNDGLQTVVERIRLLPSLDLLINNAGFGTHGRFAQVISSKHAAQLHVHVTASVLLTHAAMPGMIARRQGNIINVSSMAGLIPIRSVLYGTTKAFLVNFSEALDTELRGSGVRIQALCPGFTYTEFHDTPEYTGFDRRRIPRFLWLTSAEVVRESLDHLNRRSVICIPGFQYKIIGIIARNNISGYFIRRIGARLFHK
jgi:short-subunit dehydrogenase